MRSLLILSLAVLIVCLAPQAWGHEDEAAGPLAQRWASLFADHDVSAGSTAKPLTSPLFQTTLTSTFALHPGVLSRLRDLSPETDRPRTRALVATTTWLKGTFVTETEVANSLGGAGWLQSKIPGDTRDDASTRMIRLGLTGAKGVLRYGMTYRTAGQAFLNAPDQAGREVWGEWKTHWATVRSTIGQLWNNVAGESTRSRLEHTYGRVGLSMTRPSWPELSLTYARSSLSSTLDPLGIAPQRTQNHTLEGALAFQSLRWNVRLASSYILASDRLRGGAQSNAKMQTLTASFHPLNSLTITPTLAFRQEVQDWSGVRIVNPSASLALHYKQTQRLLISALGNYASTRSSDGLIYSENVGGKGILAWDIQRSLAWKTLIAIEAGYNRLTNRVAHSADTEDISGLVRIVLAAL